MVLVPSPLTAAFSQSWASPEVSTLAEPEDALGLASEEEDEEEEVEEEEETPTIL